MRGDPKFEGGLPPILGPSWVLGPPPPPELGPIGAQGTPDLRGDPKLGGGLSPMLGPSLVF